MKQGPFVIVVAGTIAEGREWARAHLDEPQKVDVFSTVRSLEGLIFDTAWVLPSAAPAAVDVVERNGIRSHVPVHHVRLPGPSGTVDS